MMPAEGSPSRDRLARIAAMIQQAEQAVTTSGGRRTEDARLIPLFPREMRAGARAVNGAMVDVIG